MLLTLQQQTAPGAYTPTGGYVDTAALPTSAETIIRGQLMHPHNGTPWVGAKIRWKFIGFATTATTQRPSDSDTITTGQNGTWEIRLWNNSEGDQDSHYLFKFPNDVEIKIYLAAGTPSPIEFSALAIAQTPPSDPSYPSLIELIDSKLVNVGLSLPEGGALGNALIVTQANPRVLGWAAPSGAPDVFSQTTPATEWLWNHNRGYRLNPEVYNLAWQLIDVEVEQPTVNQVKIRVNPATPGYIVA